MMHIEYELTLTFNSDWMIGTGAGRGKGLDRTVVRDADGLPYVPAKTLVGVVRAEAEILAAGLNKGDDDSPWLSWVDWLFGSSPSDDGAVVSAAPLPAALVPNELRLPLQLRQKIQAAPTGDAVNPGSITRQELLNTLTTTRAAIKEDPVAGTAVDDHLRFTEYARAGLTLSGQWSITIDHEVGDGNATEQQVHQEIERDYWPALVLLQGALEQTRAIGGQRRRGAGWCEIKVQPHGSRTLHDLVADHRHDAVPPPPPRPETAHEQHHHPEGAYAPLRHVADLVLTFEQPVLVGPTTRGTVTRSRSVVPGATLLPILGSTGLDLGRLLAHDQIVVTDATTVDANGQRCLPWPSALAVGKRDKTAYTNVVRAHESDPGLRAPKDAFIGLSDDIVQRVDVTRVDSTHAVIDDSAQRPTSNSGGLFVYSALSAGTRMIAEVWASDAVNDTDINQVAGCHRIGTSRKDDFGRVSIEVRDPAGRADNAMIHLAAPQDIQPGQPTAVWALSDVLLTDPYGDPDPTPNGLAQALSEQWGCGVTVAPATTGQTASFPACSREARRESWQSTWGLPRPSLHVMTAGSVVSVVTDAPVPAEKVRLVETNGIGIRRGEGLGRLSVAAPLLAMSTVDVRDADAVADQGQHPEPQLDDAHQDLWTTIVTDAWRERLRGTALDVAMNPQCRAMFLPATLTRSQLGSVRRLAEMCKSAPNNAEDTTTKFKNSVTNSAARSRVWGGDGNQLDILCGLVAGAADAIRPVIAKLGSEEATSWWSEEGQFPEGVDAYALATWLGPELVVAATRHAALTVEE